MSNLNLETGRTWKIVNPLVKNAVGDPVGYKFLPGDNAFPFGSPNAWWRKRAGFVNHHVWVTPYQEDERYAAGEFPNQSQGGDGLPKWTAADRAIANTDVVLWYTFGHTHIARTEEYPVMPTVSCSSPTGFSTRIRPTTCRRRPHNTSAAGTLNDLAVRMESLVWQECAAQTKRRITEGFGRRTVSCSS